MSEYFAVPGGNRPFSEAVKAGNTLYVSGTVGIDRETKTFPKDFSEQARLAIENLKNTLEKHGYSLDDLVKVVVLITEIEHAADFNEIYVKAFKDHLPARTLTGIKLVGDAKVELDAIAYKD